MDIYEFHDRYGITFRKARRMQSDGVLKLEKDKTPEYWRKAVSDIQKGDMSARSVALAFKFPEQLDRIATLSRKNRAVIKAHFEEADLPPDDIDLDIRVAAPIGAVEKHQSLLNEFITAVQKAIPDHGVGYPYIVVRLLLICDADFQINLMAEHMTRAFASIRDEPSMKGWWHHSPGKYGKQHIVYHRPYDL